MHLPITNVRFTLVLNLQLVHTYHGMTIGFKLRVTLNVGCVVFLPVLVYIIVCLAQRYTIRKGIQTLFFFFF